MVTRLAAPCLFVLAMNIPSAWASDAVESGVPMETPGVVATVAPTALGATAGIGGAQSICKPIISSKMSHKNRRLISESFQVALDRVREIPGCGEMFSELGADGTDCLCRVFFIPMGRHEALGNVCSGAVAYTLVGGGPVRLCRTFSRLSSTQAAMVIIHEALHHAGLTEYPQDPDAMTSASINQMVMKRCGL